MIQNITIKNHEFIKALDSDNYLLSDELTDDIELIQNSLWVLLIEDIGEKRWNTKTYYLTWMVLWLIPR